ncbi:hypothetical protein LTR53_020571, partial [Teratosphaeriaceae sp. CCFEE 6253]
LDASRRLPRDLRHHRRPDPGRHPRRLARPPLGSDPRCGHHVRGPSHADCRLGHKPQRLGHLLRVVALLLRHR